MLTHQLTKARRLTTAGRLATALLGTAATAGLLAAPAAAQAGTNNVRALLRTGDSLGGGETMHGLVGTPSMAPNGRWAALCTLDASGRRGLVVDGTLVLKEGDLTPDGATVATLRHTCVSSDGTIALLYNVDDPAAPLDPQARLRIGPNDILIEDQPLNAPASGISDDIDGIYGMDYDSPSLAVGLWVRSSGGAVTRAFLGGAVFGSTFTASSGGVVGGTILPDSTSGVPYYSPTGDCQTLRLGGACHTANFLDNGTIIRGLRSLGNLIAEHDQPGPAPNSTWNFGEFPRVRTNHFGTDIYSGQLTLSNGQDSGVVYLDGTAVAVEGGGLNGVLGATVADFEVASIAVDENDTPFFCVPLTVGTSEVLMAGSETVLRSGMGPFATKIGGLFVSSLYTGFADQSFDITPDGRSLIAKAVLENGDSVLLLAERDIADPTSCTTNPNSTGQSGAIEAMGSRFLSVNQLRIKATQLPPDSFGYLAISTGASFVAMPGGSSGNLCIGPTVGRYVDQVQSSGATGEIVTNINLNLVPQPTGFVASVPGDTWHCQLWHRDSGMGTATSNFTDSLSITIQ